MIQITIEGFYDGQWTLVDRSPPQKIHRLDSGHIKEDNKEDSGHMDTVFI